MESHSSCGYDGLWVDDGVNQATVHCGTDLPTAIVSASNTITLDFYSDGSVEGRGFKIFFYTGSSGKRVDRSQY